MGKEKVKCKEMVRGPERWDSFHPHRCSNWAVKDGYCTIHHPDTVEKRRKASEKRYEERWRNTPLNIACRKIEKLEAENEELKRRLREYES